MVVASPPPSLTPVTSRSATVACFAAVAASAAPPLAACVATPSMVLLAAFSAD